MPVQNSAVAIVGYACRLPQADGAESFWSLLDAGKCAVGEVQDGRWAKNRFGHPDPQVAGKSYTWSAGQIDDPWGFDPMFFGISPREALQIDPQQRILLQVVWEALEHAGIPASRLAGTETGVFVGAASVDHSYRFYADTASADIQLMTGNTLSIVSNRISYIFDLKGPSFTVDTACSSSIVALHQALEALRSGNIDTAIIGGVNMLLSPFAFVGFSRASMLSPTGLCRAFDADGDGYVRSEGAVVFVLKTLEAAKAAGDQIHGVILGSGVNSDGRTVGLSLPSAKQQAALLRHIYDKYEIDPENLAYIEAHGTGTRVGDPAEAQALGEVLGRQRHARLPIGSVKTNIGHLEAASGLAGLLKAQLILEKRRIPPSLHFRTPNPDIDFAGLNIEVVTEGRPLVETGAPLAIGVNSFGFGGTNAHVVFREPTPAEVARPKAPSRSAPLVISAQSPDALKVLAERYRDMIADASQGELARLTNAAAYRRDRLDHRLIALGGSAGDIAGALDAYLADRKGADHVVGRATSRNAPVVFAFSGNGSQWAGMGQAAYKADAVFRSSFDTVSRLFMRIAGWSLATQLFSTDLATEINRTEIAQPLLFAVQVATVEALKARGVEPDMVTGHSVGEVAAAWAAGILPLEGAVFLIHVRSTQQEMTRDLGSMAALQVSVDEARKFLAEPRFKGLTLAADNSPRSVTVSGTTDAIAAVPGAMKKHRIAARRLNLAYPFHSDLIEPIHKPLIDALATLQARPERLPFFSTVVGKALPGTSLDAEYWWLNVRNPVLFRQAIEAAAEAGGKVFVEIGASSVLKNYIVDSIAGINKTGAFVNSLEQSDKETSDIFGLIAARAVVNGARFKAEAFFGKPSSLADGLPTYPWRNQPYRMADSQEATDIAGAADDHPLLGYQRHAGTGPWLAHIDTTLVPWLADHVVDTSTVFPAAGFVEMVLAAAARHLGDGPIEIRDLDILRPLVFEDGETAEVRTEIDASSDLIDISSRRRLVEPTFGLHVRARVGRPPIEARPTIVLPTATGPAMSGDELYALTARFGLHYGPAFRRAVSVVPTGERSLLVTLAADGTGLVHDAQLELHPTLLDAAFHGLFLLIRDTLGGDGQSFLPVRFDDLRVYAAKASPTRALIEITKASSRSIEASFTLTDADGAVVARATGARFKAMRLGRDAGPADLTYLTRAIRLANPTEPVTLPAAWTDAGARLEALGVAAPTPPDADEATLLIDAGCRAIVHDALRALADPAGRLELAAGAPARVDASALPLFYRAVDALEEDGAIERNDMVIRFGDTSPYPPAATVIATLVASYPDRIAEAAALVRLTERFAARLTAGLVDTLADAIPAALAEHLETSAPSAAAKLSTALAIGRDLAAAWPTDRSLNILLAGAGSLALARVLADLPTVTGIVLTDPDPARLDRLRLNETEGSDIEVAALGELGQGRFGPRAFDLAIVVDILGRPGAGDAVATIGRHLATGAPLVAVEAEPTLIADLIHGQVKSWWSASMAPEFPVGAYRSAESAAAALEASGFGAVIRRAVASDRLRANVLIGRAPGLAPVASPRETDPVLLLSDGDTATRGMLDALAVVLTARGRTVRVAVAHGNPGGSFTIEALDAGTDDDLKTLLGGGKLKDVVFVPRLSDAEAALPALQARVMTVHAVLNGAVKPPARLWLVAAGGSGSARGGVSRPVETGLWGLGRVVINEYPDVETRLVDIAVAFMASEAAERLADLLDQPPVEREIIVDERGLSALRHRRDKTLASRATLALSAGNVAVTLGIERQGSLDGIAWRPEPRRPLVDDQVEIAVAAAGLNFRDVMWALGLLPEEALEDGFAGATLGMECSGVITGVGPAVSRYKVGDRVITFAPACFSTHVVVADKALAPLPSTVDLEAAATIPVTFLTAFYSLVELARLEEGETVLIHGGAGGVGLAALQIALWRGARVIATAGTADKRALLTMLGAHDVLDSRSLAFADEVLALTDGEGVDVVLNSLSGEAMERSIECLKPFGRFVELGKRDYYANSRIALRPFRQNLSYFGVDADQLLTRRPKLTERLFRELVAGFEDGAFTALPYRVFAAHEITDAFRLMQGSGHIGKILVRPPVLGAAASPSPVPVRADATYLVAGGLGGFGIETARFLVERGARHLVLTSRSGEAAASALPLIEAMRQRGATIATVAADLTDEAAMTALFARIDATMPPLRGVLHTAMVLDDALFANLDAARIHKVLAPKVAGADLLDRLTRQRPLDFFVLYSSATTLIGNPGQASYVAANAYLEGLARARHAAGLPAVAIAWGAIADAGYLARNMEVNAVLSTRLGKQSLTVKAALAGLGLVFDSGAGDPVVAYGRVDWATARKELKLLATPLVADVLGRTSEGGADDMESGELMELIKGLDHADAVKKVGELLTGEISRILRLPADDIGLNRPLTEVGMDSLMAVELRMAAEQKLGVEIPILSLANGATIADISRRIVDKALGQEGEGSPADSAAAARHFADDSREDVTAVLTSLEAKAETVKRLL